VAGLFESLSTASQSMLAHRLGIDVAGQNLANINTPGYSRRTLYLAEVAPTGSLSAGRGVEVLEIRALRDRLIDARVRQETGDAEHDKTISQMLGTLEAAVGVPGSAFEQSLTAYFDAWSVLASNPTSAVGRDVVAREGSALAQAFGGLSTTFDSVRRDADLAMRATIADVNRLSGEVARLNVAIAAGGSDVNTLTDRQAQLLAELGNLVDVVALPRNDGGVDVSLRSGRPLVIGERPTSLVVGAGPGGFGVVSIDGVDITAQLTGGRIGGLLHVRDTLAPAYQAQLDQLAFDFASAVNGLHLAGFDATGAPAGAFFVPPAAVAGAAAGLAVDPAVLADSRRIAASGTGAPGDNTVARQLASLRDQPVASGGTQSVFGAWSRLAFAIGSDAAAATAAGNTHGDIVRQLQMLQAEVSGVSYDEEAANLMRYQRAYEANARYFQTILDALDAVMDMVR
jgi:flagellar hook-associated protein 1 FlgK